MGLDNPIHLAFLLVILLMVFGAKRLPEMGRSLGSGLRGFKESINGDATDAGADRRAELDRPGDHRRPPDRGLPECFATRSRTTPQLTTVGHLEELRRRLILSLAVVVAAFGVCFWQNHRLLHLINAPLAHQTQQQVRDGHGPLGATYTVAQSARDVAMQLHR